jgi:hypothetical protein
MTRFDRWRHILSPIVAATQLMVAGAWILTQYLGLRGLFRSEVDQIGSVLFVSFFGLMMVGRLLQPASAGPPLKEPAPRWSGTMVVFATGFAAALFVGWGSDAGHNLSAAIAIVLATLIVAALVWRFATTREKEIGEARFNTAP